MTGLKRAIALAIIFVIHFECCYAMDPEHASVSGPVPRYEYFTVFHYCACTKCTGDGDGLTYTGTMAKVGRTIAVDSAMVPLGSVLVIDGIKYHAEDIGGGLQGRELDIFCESHQQALERGVQRKLVVIYEWHPS